MPVIILTIIYILVLLYVYLKYNLDAKDNSEYDKIYREKLEISASEAAYLLDKKSNSLNLILADILTLIQKGYIKMETVGEETDKDYIFIKQGNKDNTAIKAHEMSAYRFFFNKKNEISLKNYLNDLKNDENSLKELELINVSIKNDLEYELRRDGITDINAEKKLLKINKFSISLIIIFIIAFFITILIRNKDYIEFSSIGLLFSILLYRITMLKEDKLTEYGVQTRKKCLGLKNYLKSYVITEDKPLYMVNLLDYYYVMAVAFGLAKLGESEFIHNTYNKIQKDKIFSNFFNVLLIIAIIIYEIIIII